MKKTYLNQLGPLFGKAAWFIVFLGLISLNYFPTTTFFVELGESLLLRSAKSQREISKPTDQNKSVPFSNPVDEKSDINNKHKDFDETIYSKNKRIVSKKTTLVFNHLSYAVLNNIPENDPFPRIFPNPSNSCFAPLYRFSIF